MTDTKGRELYSVNEVYRILVDGMRTAPLLSRARRSKVIDKPFMERIMLAVTEVNGCPVCSYAHAKMALDAGLSDGEIQQMIMGSFADAPRDQMTAIMFAQQYADNRSVTDLSAWERLNDHYGKVKAEGILGAIRIITMGNVMGIPWGSFWGRVRGKPDNRSSLGYELGTLFGILLMFPFTMIHATVLMIARRPLVK
jgi:AhpD family alkylhydroperoxidase